MAERDPNNGWVQENPPAPEKPISEYLGSFFNNNLIREILQEQDAKWVVKPAAKPELDVAFLPKGGRGENLASVSFLGTHLCVGVRLVEGSTKEEIKESMEKILQEPAIQHIYNNGFRVAFVTPTDFPLWEKFYTVAESKGLIKEYGRRVHELGGLDRASPQYAQRMRTNFENLMQKEKKELDAWGVEHTGPYVPISLSEEFFLDYAFYVKGQPLGIPMAHVRESYEGDIVREKVIDHKVLVPGVIAREAGESKQEAYNRARVAEAFYQKNLGMEKEVKVPVISAGQLSLWEKLGTFEFADPAVILKDPEARVALTPDDLINYLFLGKSSLDRGELARLGLSLPFQPDRKILRGVDILFLSRHPLTLARDFTVLPYPMIGLDLNQHDKEKFGVKEYHYVAGLVLIPETWNKDQITRFIKSSEGYLRMHLGLGPARILPVTQSLFNYWQEQGTALGSELSPIQRRFGRVERPTLYPLHTNGTEGEVYVARVRQEDIVGGNTSFIAEKKDGKIRVHAFDLGAEFNFEPSAYNALTATPTTSLGALPSLDSGQVPMIPGFQETEYLIAAAQNNPALFRDKKNPVYRYILAELYARLELEGDRFEKAGLSIEEITASGKEAYEDWYRAGDWRLSNIILGHLHWDHAGELGSVTSDAKIIAPNEQLAIMRAMTASAPRWTDKLGYVSLITEKKNGAAYQRIERVTQPYRYGERIAIGNGLFYTGEAISHSIPSQMQYFEVEGGKNFLNTGDIRVGDEWALTETAVSKLAGKPQVIFLETTNPPGTEKISAGVSEADVRGNIEKVFRKHNSSVIVVVAPKNHNQRITSIIEAAENVGRKVALGPKHAAITNQISFDQALSDEDIRSFEYALPILGQDVALWLRPYTKLGIYEEALRDISSEGELGVVDAQRLSEENDKWVVVLSPWDLLENSFSKMHANHGVTYLWSSYYTYDIDSKKNVSANYNWLKRETKNNFYGDLDVPSGGRGQRVLPRLHPDGPFHASGHATFEQLFDKVLVPLLDNKYKDKSVILVHGSEPAVYAQTIRKNLSEYEDRRLAQTAFWARKRLGLAHPEDLKIIWQIDRYNPRNPIDPKSPLGLNVFTHRLR